MHGHRIFSRCSLYARAALRRVQGAPLCFVTGFDYDRGCRSLSSQVAAAEKLRWSYSNYTAETRLMGVTIGRLLQERAERHPDRDAAVFHQDGQRLSVQQLLEEADHLAAGLLSLGLKKGDRVGMWGPNSKEWVLTQYATARAGLILVCVNPLYRKRELEYVLKKSGCKALVAASGFKDLDYNQILFDLIPELASCSAGHIHSHLLPELSVLIMLGKEKLRGTFSFDDLLAVASLSEVKAITDIQDTLQFDEPINIQFTSGTTGYPKGATLSHHNIVNSAYNTGHMLGYHNRETRICCPLSLYHCSVLVLASLQLPCHGATVVSPSKAFDAGVTLDAVETEKCTALYGVPTMFIDMLNHKNMDSTDLSSLYTGMMGGSPCPIEVMRQVMDKMHMSDVRVIYGATETSPTTFFSPRDCSLDQRVSTVGRVVSNVEAKVVDENDRVVPVGVTGELCTRGYTTMLGYWDDTEKTAECVTPDRWFHTGDQAVME